MCDRDILFCIFYYLGFIAVGGAFFAGWFIISSALSQKRE